MFLSYEREREREREREIASHFKRESVGSVWSIWKSIGFGNWFMYLSTY